MSKPEEKRLVDAQQRLDRVERWLLTVRRALQEPEAARKLSRLRAINLQGKILRRDE